MVSDLVVAESDLRSEMAVMRSELRAAMATIRSELKAEIKREGAEPAAIPNVMVEKVEAAAKIVAEVNAHQRSCSATMKRA